MSVNQESMVNSGATSSKSEAPELEFISTQRESLVWFGSMLGGAILGMLGTLLVLAIVNSGTLRFVGGSSRLGQIETAYNQLSGNVGANTTNIETLDSNMGTQVQMLDDKISQQHVEIEGINRAVSNLDASSGQFDTLVDALSGAINTINGVEPEATGEASAAPSSAEAAEGTEMATGDSSLSVLFFADANENQELDAGEESLLGISVSLINADGESVATLESTDGGMQFEGLAPGDYTLMVDDAGDYTLTSNELGTVSVGEGAEQSVFIAVGSE